MAQLDPADYTIAWIAPLYIEARAALLLFDHRHEGSFSVGRGDDYIFQAGDICGHNVILATLPAGQEYGNSSAAALASQVKKFFPNLWFGLLVGVAAGLPNLTRKSPIDIRLGDVLVGIPQGENAGTVAYELGKETAEDGLQLLHHGHILATTETIVRSAIGNIQLDSPDEADSFLRYYRQIQNAQHRDGSFTDPGQENDLYHERNDNGDLNLVLRDRRPSSKRTRVWYGCIGSGDKLMKNALKRNELRDKYNIIGLEMEAAGTMNRIPVGVIRGVCDYGDQHKNKNWQPYAAAMAAAYAKAVLAKITPETMPSTVRPLTQNGMLDVVVGTKRRSGEDICEAATNARSKRPRLERSDPEATMVQPEDVQPGALNDERKKALLDSLMFDQIDSRYETIKRAHAKTCQWLLKTREYLDWLDQGKAQDHHGILWILGNPGAGKSTLMKFLFEKARKTVKSKGNKKVISFFFNARGDDLEKSTSGMFRSLLVQLLDELPGLQNIFNSLGVSVRNGLIPDWSVELLQKLFEKAIQSLGKSTLVCFIDALDECDQEQIREMISFFQDVSELARSEDIAFQLCFSSRFYPLIKIRKGIIQLDLGKQQGHAEDIASYVQSKLDIEPDDFAEQIRTKIIEKASGIFMWVVLVVGILQKEHERGQDHTLLQRLNDIPQKLDELFHDILMRDDRDRHRMLLCIQWMLFAMRPMKPQELHQAILCGLDPTALSWGHIGDFQGEPSERFILDSSKGLADITKSKKSQTVQFIHESVREFFFKGGFNTIWPSLTSNFHGESHEQLKECCSAYIKIAVADFKISALPSPVPTTQAEYFRQSAGQSFPFLDYAVRNVLCHADIAEEHGIHQSDFLQTFNRTHWVKLHTLVEKYQSRLHSPEVSLLYLLAELDAANLIKCCPTGRSAFEREGERYGVPILAAVALNSRRAVWQLLKQEADQEPLTPVLKAICENYDRSKGKRGPGLDFKFSKQRSTLVSAAAAGDETVVAFILARQDSALDLVGSLEDRVAALYMSAKSGKEAIVQLLVEAGVDVNVRVRSVGGNRTTPLHLAAFSGHDGVVQILLNNDAYIEALDGTDHTPLVLATAGGHASTVRILLDGGADMTAVDFESKKLLTLAIELGHRDVVELLLDRGATMSFPSSRESTLLIFAINSSFPDVVQLLLERGAPVHERDFLGWTPIAHAVNVGSWKKTQLLLDQGASADKACFEDRTLLSCAAARGHKELVQLLLDKGATVDLVDAGGRTPLMSAVGGGHEDTAKLLLNRGAVIDLASESHLTPLSYASERGQTTLVQLLLDKGAAVDGSGRYEQMPLIKAIEQGFLNVAMLLLEHGAALDAHGGDDRTLLHTVAARSDAAALIQHLLGFGANIHALDWTDRTPLHYAGRHGCAVNVRRLLESGANIEASDRLGRTPLHLAVACFPSVAPALDPILASVVFHGSNQPLQATHIAKILMGTAVRVLLDSAAAINAVDSHGSTPLHLAMSCTLEPKYRKILIMVLLDYGASLEITDIMGRTPRSLIQILNPELYRWLDDSVTFDGVAYSYHVLMSQL
ncbi:hypothetical protein NLG97_g4106 [Lecanicillium saksenae]|uniref:Uncharacterized protein n=1 Tax=Lecanicillium saksenae TaxID=468837 RepID=A0ACC1QW79_9HYPO|nr:hypothetical protein NLG97_g4106 [Lecanicillium saksenae]